MGIEYLDACPTEGRGHLEALLSKVPFRTNEKALKIMHIAAERGLSDVGKLSIFIQTLFLRSSSQIDAA